MTESPFKVEDRVRALGVTGGGVSTTAGDLGTVVHIRRSSYMGSHNTWIEVEWDTPKTFNYSRREHRRWAAAIDEVEPAL